MSKIEQKKELPELPPGWVYGGAEGGWNFCAKNPRALRFVGSHTVEMAASSAWHEWENDSGITRKMLEAMQEAVKFVRVFDLGWTSVEIPNSMVEFADKARDILVAVESAKSGEV